MNGVAEPPSCSQCLNRRNGVLEALAQGRKQAVYDSLGPAGTSGTGSWDSAQAPLSDRNMIKVLSSSRVARIWASSAPMP